MKFVFAPVISRKSFALGGLLVTLALRQTVPAATFTVLNTNLTGPGSLQQAIFDANTNVGTDTIQFAITNLTLTISPTDALPAIVQPVTIDGATQPGFTGAPIVEINGMNAGAAVDGLKIRASNCVIRGLVINRFLGHGIEIANGANTAIQGNYIGTDTAGTLSKGNGGDGVFVNGGAGALIGGALAGQGNLISGNGGDGIELSGASCTNNRVFGNLIGADISGTLALGNASHGVFIRNSSHGNLVGGVLAGQANLIAFNTGNGISIAAATSSTNNSLRGNSIFSNGGLGIDLDDNGVTANDDGDGDTGGNNRQNFPVLTGVVLEPSRTIIAGRLNSATNATFRLDFFKNTASDPSGFGEGQTFLFTTNVTTDASGNVDFACESPTPLASNQCVTATATDASNNTSEFSACRRAVPYDTIDLSLTLTDSGDPVARSTNFTYTLTIANEGPTNATGVLARDVLPAGVSFVTAAPSQGTYSNNSGVIVCALGTLNAGATATVTIEVAATVSGSLSNYATVSANEADNDPANNSDLELTQAGIANLAVSTVDSPDPVVAGQPLTNTVTVFNFGPDPATGTVLGYNPNYASVVTLVSLSQGTFTQNGGISCQLGTLASGAAATLKVVAIPLSSGTSADYAFVTHNDSDPVLSNNTFSATTTVTDGAGVIQFENSIYGTNENSGAVAITVSRSGGDIGSVTVDLSTADLAAIGGSDYVPTNATLTFLNGETNKTLFIGIIDDPASECNEAFTVSLSNPTGGAVVFGRTNATVQIFDNEITASGAVEAVSVLDADHIRTTGNSGAPDLSGSISADGRYVVFASSAENLAFGDNNFDSDVFLHDRVTHSNRLLTLNRFGTASANNDSRKPRISSDGRVVVYESYANDLTANDAGGYLDVYANEVATGSNFLVSVTAAGTGSGNNSSYSIIGSLGISSNAQVVVFESYASDLVANDTNGLVDVFARDLGSQVTKLVSINLASTGSGDSTSFRPAVSGDGRFVAFASGASDLVADDSNETTDVFVRNLTNDTTTLVSVNSAGTDSGDNSSGDSVPAISHDGRYVAFDSAASDLTTNADSNGLNDVFWRDLQSGVTRLVSVATNGASGNGFCILLGMSADGRYVLFSSDANNLVANDNNDARDLFVRDLTADATTLVSINAAGNGPGNDGSLADAAISADGRYVVFASYATDLVAANKEPFVSDVFVRDLVAGTTKLISVRNGSADGGDDDSFATVLSANGNVAAFLSLADDVAEHDHNSSADVFARDLGTNTTELLSLAVGQTGNDYSFDSVLSADGKRVAFATYSSDLIAADLNNDSDVFVRDLAGGSNILVSVNLAGTGTGDGSSDVADLSADGRFVVFYSEASDLVSGDTNSYGDIFLRDTLLGTTLLISANSAGTGSGNRGSYNPDLTPDGRFVVFESEASNLVVNDLNGAGSDIFLRDRSNSVPELITANGAGTGSANSDSYNPAVSDDGRYVAFESNASDLGPTDTNGRYDVYVRDRQAGTNILCSRNLAGTDAGNNDSFHPRISANGRYVIFESTASNLVAGDTNNATDIFAFDVTTRTLQLVTANTNGVPGNGFSFLNSITPDGRYVAFESAASDLAANDSNGDRRDVFVRDLFAGATTLVSINCNGNGSGSDDSYLPAISADGRYVAFESFAWDLAPGDYSAKVENIFRRDLLTGATVLVSQNRPLAGGGNDHSYYAQISTNGSVVSFESDARDLIAEDANANSDVFAWTAATVVSSVDLALDKSASTNSVVQGGSLTYTITVTNRGAANGTGVIVTDMLPGAVSFVSASASQGSVTNSGGTVTANLGSLNSGAGGSISITVAAVTPGNAVNVASATAAEPDPNPANNSDVVVVTILPLTPPTLTVTRTNSTQVLLNWPSSTPSAFTLETTTNLKPIIVWDAVTNAVEDNGTRKSVLITPAPGEHARFYRLRN